MSHADTTTGRAAPPPCLGGAMLSSMTSGGRAYFLWVLALAVVSVLGLHAYARQVAGGLYTTGMTDHVSWGFYIANFTFFVGVAAAAAMIVIPVYLYDRDEFHDVALFGEIMAIAAVVICLCFVTVDIGRIDRFWHLLPGLGLFNWPASILTWDVIVLNGYLALNLAVVGYALWSRHRGRHPDPRIHLPLVFVAIVWAISIHTVTAFLYAGLPARPFWHSALLAPRFIASAFASGPALMVLAFALLRGAGGYPVPDRVFALLRSIMQVTMTLHIFFFGCEFFVESYGRTGHSASFDYLFFGLHGHAALRPWIWSALALDLAAYALLLGPRPFRRGADPAGPTPRLLAASVLAAIGVWIEKGMGLVIPGFIPTPLGEVVEYRPSANELLVCAGVLAFGLLVFTLLAKAAIPILKDGGGHGCRSCGGQR